MALEQIRREIDDVDTQILALLEKRMALIDQIAQFKIEKSLPIYDGVREEEVLKKISKQISNETYEPTIMAIYESLFLHSKRYQQTFFASQDKIID